MSEGDGELVKKITTRPISKHQQATATRKKYRILSADDLCFFSDQIIPTTDHRY
jgi:hypothetical protein